MGKGGGPLNVWLKEFTALVFTQTIQAFIYAIIISMILFGMFSENGDISGSDNNSALGLMAVFALTSVFKVEEMAKKIFGLGDTKASPKGAMRSLAKTAFAAKLGKRVLNNVGKVTGGIGAITKSRQDNKKALARLEEDMSDNGFKKDKSTGKIYYEGKKKAGGGTVNPLISPDIDVETGLETEGIDGGDIVKASGKAANSYEISDSAQRRMRNALRNYEDKVSEIKKARNEGIKSILAGATETVGASIGAATGGLIGGADGNLDEMLQGVVAGAGVGDAIGEATVNTLVKATNFVSRNYDRKTGISNKELKRAINSYKSALESTKVNYGSSSVDDI